MRWTSFLWLAGCVDAITPTGDLPDVTSTEMCAPSFDGGGELTLADADLALPPDVFAQASPWSFQVVDDLGGDGSDDIVGFLYEGGYPEPIRQGFEIWPDAFGSAPALLLTSPASTYSESFGTRVGVTELRSIPDVTSDGVLDVWVYEVTEVWTLMAGPIQAPITDPASLAVATAENLRTIELATDLDGDGTGEFVGGYGPGVSRCEGPFAGGVSPDVCPTATHPEWSSAKVIGEADLDGDGVHDLLVALEGLLLPNGSALGVAALAVFDGGFVDGTTDPVLTATPSLSAFFQTDQALLGDLDCDGYGDLAWVEEPNYFPSDEAGEITVAHGPFVQGAEIDSTDATLHWIGTGSEAVFGGRVERGAAVAPWVLLSRSYSLGLGIPGYVPTPAWSPMLADASVQGTVDPADTAWQLGVDTSTFEGTTSTEARIGAFDGDDLDDVVVFDPLLPGGWLYLGASLP